MEQHPVEDWQKDYKLAVVAWRLLANWFEQRLQRPWQAPELLINKPTDYVGEGVPVLQEGARAEREVSPHPPVHVAARPVAGSRMRWRVCQRLEWRAWAAPWQLAEVSPTLQHPKPKVTLVRELQEVDLYQRPTDQSPTLDELLTRNTLPV